jgi:L-threonylcarbamoyladenylate synthase
MLQRVDPQRPDEAIIARAAEILRSGGLVAFPTETVYGLGANALDAAAVDRIYAAKGRPLFNPLIVHVADADHVRDVAAEWPDKAERLARAFWPGPLTLVVPKRREVPSSVTAGLDTVAVRVPSHPVARALLMAARIPVAAPSANRSTEVSPTTGAHVEKSLGDAVDLILDAGPTLVGIESTVVDLTFDPPAVLRPGIITREDLARVIGEIGQAKLIVGIIPRQPAEESPTSAEVGDAPRRSPGMLNRHYAPRASLVLVDGERVSRLIAEKARAGKNVGAVLIAPGTAPSAARRTIELGDDPTRYAAGLYAALHDLDDDGVDVIVVERPPNRPEWYAVLDRLARGAHR